MIVTTLEEIQGTEREVRLGEDGFTSFRYVLARERMGFSLHKTIIPRGEARHWHYLHHLEACYCLAGKGYLTNLETGEVFEIVPDTVYVLDSNDDHTFQAITDVVLLSIFNPPVTGRESHDNGGSYPCPE